MERAYPARRQVKCQLSQVVRTSCTRSWPAGIQQFPELSASQAAGHQAGACCRRRVDRRAEVSRSRRVSDRPAAPLCS